MKTEKELIKRKEAIDLAVNEADKEIANWVMENDKLLNQSMEHISYPLLTSDKKLEECERFKSQCTVANNLRRLQAKIYHELFMWTEIRKEVEAKK